MNLNPLEELLQETTRAEIALDLSGPAIRHRAEERQAAAAGEPGIRARVSNALVSIGVWLDPQALERPRQDQPLPRGRRAGT
jgi:hypothetical protein